MRFWTLVLVVGTLLLAPRPAFAGPDEAIYRIEVKGCPNQSSWLKWFTGAASADLTRIQTGFRVDSTQGIYTALHGVAGCASITATPTTGAPLVGLTITQVDIAHDVALLGPVPALTGALTSTTSSTSAITVQGYPHAMRSRLSTKLAFRSPATTELWRLVPGAHAAALTQRASPDTTKAVLSVEGHLTVGHSGAPILASGAVIGMANGGVANGALEIAWAIPFRDISLVPKASAATQLARIATADAVHPDLFAAAYEETPLAGFSCFNLNFRQIRTVTAEELGPTVDVPSTFQSAAAYFGAAQRSTRLAVFRDDSAGITLVIPPDWTVRAVDGRCEATAPVPGVTLEFHHRASTAADPTADLLMWFAQVEFDRLCRQAYINDPTASMPRPVVSVHRGVLSRAKSYTKQDWRCLPLHIAPVFQPGSMTSTARVSAPPGYATAPAPQLQPLGPSQCGFPTPDQAAVAVCPPGTVPQPAFWAYSSVPTAPELARGVAFMHAPKSHTTMLFALARHQDAAAVQRMIACRDSFGIDDACRQAYLNQAVFVDGVLAALGSTLTP
jgi:hypothetical protein